MNVQEFVKEALIQVLSGIDAAQETANELGGRVGGKAVDFHPIQFDIALVTVEQSDSGGGIRVAGIGGGGQESTRESSTSRIQFSVPVRHPSNR